MRTDELWIVMQQASCGEQMAALQKELEQLHTAGEHMEEQYKAAEAGQLNAQVLGVFVGHSAPPADQLARLTPSRAELFPLHLPAFAFLLLLSRCCANPESHSGQAYKCRVGQHG